MSPDSLLHQFDDLKFIAEEQDVVFTNATTVAILEDDPRFSLVGRVITSHAVDGLMSESLGHSLGACTGSAVGIDMRIIDGNMGEFLRVQISIDVSKPLRRCVALGGCGAGARADVPSGPAPFVAATPLRSIPVLASIASPLGVATATSLNAEEGVVVSTEATVSVDGSHDVLAVDVSSKVRITDNILFGDERDVFVTRVAHEAVAPAFDAIEEWLAEDNDSDVQITVDLPVKIPAKRSSGGSDPSKAKRASLFTSSSFENSEILNHILPTVTSHMNASLLRPFTTDEVVTAFQNIGHGKAPAPPSQRQLCWCPPPEDFVKINTDGAFNQSSHEAGIGVVARNSTGEVLGGFVQHSGISIDALHTEFFVVVAGIQFAHEKGWRDVHIETNSTIVVNKFNRIGPGLSVLGSQVERYRPLLGEFNVSLINFTPKCCNSVAHTLATHASTSGLSFFFGSDCPALIRSNVLADKHS
ncbi:hypothetical protein V6N11_018377 [Hibiscus sabdariffa]|uniref:RNase H type-1 domain-containing protein n=1 Tax=Hibiscus sabdariffa TaxID=183260 RepID=A0ABR2T7C4_9ROSI